jgi:hypothetical protein
MPPEIVDQLKEELRQMNAEQLLDPSYDDSRKRSPQNIPDNPDESRLRSSSVLSRSVEGYNVSQGGMPSRSSTPPSFTTDALASREIVTRTVTESRRGVSLKSVL